MEGKICTKCGEWKPMKEYGNTKKTKDGKVAQCKECLKKYSKEYRKNNIEKVRERSRKYRETHKEEIKEFREKNKDKKKESNRQYYENNKSEILRKNKEYRKRNYDKEKERERSRKWREENSDKAKECSRRWREKNPEYKKEWGKNNREQNIKKIELLAKEMNLTLKELPLYGYIYKFENIKTGRVYIGQTVLALKRRYKNGIIKGWIKERLKKENQKFKEELVEEDIEVTEVLDVGCCKYHLDKLEVYYINKFNSCDNGYNIEVGNHDTDDGIEEFKEILEKYNLKYINGELRKNG
jgi:hypothetical protein